MPTTQYSDLYQTPPLAFYSTPLQTSAYWEQFDNAGFPVKSRARHLHFTWDENLILAPNLKELKAGEGRYSREGVLYRQIFAVEDPKLLEFHVPGGQFSHYIQGVGVVDCNGFNIIVLDDKSCLDGALVKLSLTYVDLHWEFVRNPTGDIVAGCEEHGGKVELGKPTKPPESSLVRKLMRSLSQRLTRRDTTGR